MMNLRTSTAISENSTKADITRLLPLLALARPKHYVKNLFLFLPLFFSGGFTNLSAIGTLSVGFIAFSLIASAIYAFNDWCDKSTDRTHPVKCKRPIPAGLLSTQDVMLFIMGCSFSSFMIISSLSYSATVLIMSYFVLNIAYSIKLKHIAVIDVTLIAVGFVLRLMVGATLCDITLSPWIVIMTFLLALFLALGKRRDDLLILTHTNNKQRQSLDGYNLAMVDGAMIMCGAITTVTYLLWAVLPDAQARLNSEYLYITAVFVIMGIMRYMTLTYVKQRSANPTHILLNDTFIQLTVVAWIGTFVCLIY